MNRFFYTLFIRLYPFIARLISPFNNKAKLWVEGRKDIFTAMRTALAGDDSKKIWMHCASLGEFEQGRPLLEKIRQLYPQKKLVVTFFSPSGYEIQKNSKLADYVFYMPVDSAENAKNFLEIVQPSTALFIKYEYWYYYLKTLQQQKIPVFLVSGIFLPQFIFFKWYGGLYRKMLTFFTHLFVQTEESKTLLKRINISNVTVTGDTRFDRVLQVAANPQSFPEIEKFINHTKTIVAGSTWTDDDEALDHYVNTHPELKFIIAPHNIGKERLKECGALYKHSILYSEYIKRIQQNRQVEANINTLIIDNIGTLKFLYRYATVCFVGGGFGNDGIHNVLEATVYYKPVLFGPAHEKFSEAIELITKGGAFDVEDALELENELNTLLLNDDALTTASRIAGNYVQENGGATEAIIHYFQEKRLFTS